MVDAVVLPAHASTTFETAVESTVETTTPAPLPSEFSGDITFVSSKQSGLLDKALSVMVSPAYAGSRADAGELYIDTRNAPSFVAWLLIREQGSVFTRETLYKAEGTIGGAAVNAARQGGCGLFGDVTIQVSTPNGSIPYEITVDGDRFSSGSLNPGTDIPGPAAPCR